MQAPTWEDADKEFSLNHCLIQNGEGQYLWLRIELIGDGYSAPTICSIRLDYPRDTYIRYLPSIFRSDEENRRFLERFLTPFQQEMESLQRQVEEFALYCDPASVPEGVSMDFLAGWLGIEFESVWSSQQRRHMLMAGPALLRTRGTIKGLLRLLQVYLENASGINTEEPALPSDSADARRGKQERMIPKIIEGFRLRNCVQWWLQTCNEASAGHPAPLVQDRFELDSSQLDGDAQLITFGTPKQDQWNLYAHRFYVFVPAMLLRMGREDFAQEQQRLLHEALSREKPAHTSYQLHLFESQMTLGLLNASDWATLETQQAWLGINTILGEVPTLTLAASQDASLNVLGAAHLAATNEGTNSIAGNMLGINTRII